MAEPLKVTVHNPNTGQTITTDIPPGSYLLICAEPARRTGLTAHANGTHQITVRGVTDPLDEMFHVEGVWPARQEAERD